jgi:hypothetical protein
LLCLDEENVGHAMHLRDLKRSGMIKIFSDEVDERRFKLSVHTLYREFAEWYVTEHEAEGLKNAWGVFQTSDTRLQSSNIKVLVRLGEATLQAR